LHEGPRTIPFFKKTRLARLSGSYRISAINNKTRPCAGLNIKEECTIMRNRLPEEHHVFAAALPDIRAHFEDAAKRSPDHFFVLNTIAEDLRETERRIACSVISAVHLERSRATLIHAAEGSDYYPMIAHEFETALDIALHHQKRLKGPGL
jgi:hypothetical protein